MSIPTLDPETQRLVLRVKAKDTVFWAEPADVLEEIPGIYRGFEVDVHGKFEPAPLERILKIHKLKMLFVQFPGKEPDFCDLTEEDIRSDPFSLIKQAAEKGLELWEYNAFRDESVRVFPTDDGVNPYTELLEDSLFQASSS